MRLVLKDRYRIRPSHPVVGRDYRLLDDCEVIEASDETERISLLLSLDEPADWRTVPTDSVGKTVSQDLVNDMDAAERIYRRRKETNTP